MKRRQLADKQQTSDAPVYTLPGFRPGSCLSADSQLGRFKPVQRPGTPNVKPVGTSAAPGMRTTSAAVTAFANLHKPTSAPEGPGLSVSSALAAAAAYKTAAAVAHQLAVTAVAKSESKRVEIPDRAGIRPTALPSTELSDSDDSGWSLLDSDSSLESCSNAAAGVEQSQLVYTPGTVGRRCLQISEALQHAGNNHDASMTTRQKLSGATTIISSPNNSLGRPHSYTTNGTDRHIGGNTLVCISSKGQATHSGQQQWMQEPLMQQSSEIMHWLGMDNMWFEETFLPLAESSVQSCI